MATTTALLGARGHASCAAAAVRAGRARPARRRRLVQQGARSFPTSSTAEYLGRSEAERAIRSGKPLPAALGCPSGPRQPRGTHVAGAGIILAAAAPLSRIVPPLYQFRIRSRVFRWYAQLRDIENRSQAQPREAAGAVRSSTHSMSAWAASGAAVLRRRALRPRNNIDAVRRSQAVQRRPHAATPAGCSRPAWAAGNGGSAAAVALEGRVIMPGAPTRASPGAVRFPVPLPRARPGVHWRVAALRPRPATWRCCCRSRRAGPCREVVVDGDARATCARAARA